MFRDIFKNIGFAVKVIAVIVLVLGIILSFIVGIIECVETREMFRGVIIIVIGVLSSFISSIFIFAFGELVETNKEIAENTRKMINSSGEANNIVDKITTTEVKSTSNIVNCTVNKKPDGISNNSLPINEKNASNSSNNTVNKEIKIKANVKSNDDIINKLLPTEVKQNGQFALNINSKPYNQTDVNEELVTVTDVINSLTDIECPMCFHCISKNDVICPHCGYKLK